MYVCIYVDVQQQKTQWLQMENMKNLGDLGFTSKTCCPQSPGTVGLVYRLEGLMITLLILLLRSCARGDTICPRPSPPVGSPADAT